MIKLVRRRARLALKKVGWGISHKLVLLIACWALLASEVVGASSRFGDFFTAFDLTVDSPVGPVGRQDILQRFEGRPTSIVSLPIPSTATISALDEASGTFWFVTDIVSNVGLLTATPRDVISLSSDGEISVAIDSSQLGLKPPARITGIARYQDGLLFSIDTTSEVSGIRATPRDILFYDGQTVNVLASGSALKIATTDRLSTLAVSKQGEIIYSLTGASTLGGAGTLRGTLFLYSPSSQNVKAVTDYRETLGSCLRCSLTAIAGKLDSDVIFSSSFEFWSID